MNPAPQPWSWTEPARPPFAPLAPNIPATVWCAPVPPPSDPLRTELAALLSPEEHIRLARLRQPADQLRFLTGRALIRRLLGAHLHRPPASLGLHIGPSGKPFITLPPETPPLHFNLSHSGDFVLVAFSETHEVGIDIERIDSSTDCSAIAAGIFPLAIHSAWLNTPPKDRLNVFYQLWTRHEARIKALGHGFAREPDASALATLRCFDLQLPPGYTGALALA